MHWTIATNNPIDCGTGPTRLDFEYGVQGNTSGYDKGTNMVGSLAAQLPLYLGGDPAPADPEFDCVNRPQYNCRGKVDRVGARCPQCREMGRGIGGKSAPHPVDSHDQYGTEIPEHDAEPGDAFDCVNKPEYDCPEEVDRAGARCSTCRALNRGMGGSRYNQYGTGRPTHDAEYDEGDPHVLSHNPSRLDDD